MNLQCTGMGKTNPKYHSQTLAFEERLQDLHITRPQMYREMGVTKEQYQNWRARGIPKGETFKAARIAKCDPEALLKGEIIPETNPSNATSITQSRHYSTVKSNADGTPDLDEVYGIEYYEAKGSCGGGIHNGQDRLAGKITRKASWFFRFFDVKPENCKAIYADGDSMADFIIDGDMVLFDISRRTPISGKIFLLRYPNGLRIKELYEQSMGKWKVKSRNPDYDDEEVVSPEDVEIIGQFIYRQGGIFW